MKIKLAVLVTLLALGGSLFAQSQNVKGTYGFGPPAASIVPGDVGSRYIDQSTNPPAEYICTSITVTGAGVPNCTWTAASGGGITPVATLPATCTAGVTADVKLTVATLNNPIGQYGCAGPPAPANTWFLVGPGIANYNTFTSGYFGLSPNDYGAAGNLKFCNDGNVAGQPTPTFTSSSTKALTNSVLLNNVITFTFANTTASGGVLIGPAQSISVTGSTHNAVFNVTNLPVQSATTTTLTVNLVNANIGTAADTGTLTTTVGCANFSQADVGKTIEIVGAGTTGVFSGNSTTILSVQSAISATLTANSTINVTGKKFWYGRDDTAELQAWVTDINNGIPTSFGPKIHSGYFAGLYLTLKPLRFINPLVPATGFAYSGNQGYGPPEPFQASDNENEGLSLWGQSSYRSGIVSGSQFNWQFPSASVNNGVLYLNNWNGSTIQNFFVGAPDYASIAYNTAANTGIIAGLLEDQNAHQTMTGMQVENFHNSTSNLFGHTAIGWFQNVFMNTQLYINDCGSTFGSNTTGQGSELTVENVTWWNAGVAATCSVVNLQGVNGWENVNFINFNIFPGTGAALAALRIADASTGNSDEVKFTNGKMNCGTNQECIVWTGTGNSKWAFTNLNLQSGGTATGIPIDQLAANTIDVHFFGGTVACAAACANGITNATGGVFHMNGTRLSGTVGIVGTGAAQVFQTSDTATGWGGPGSWSASTYLTQTNCAVNSVSPAACGAAAAGAVVVPTGTTTYTINTTAVTAASRITITPMSFAGNLPSAPTCVVPTTPFIATVSAITAATSFTLTLPNTTGQTCWQYIIEN